MTDEELLKMTPEPKDRLSESVLDDLEAEAVNLDIENMDLYELRRQAYKDGKNIEDLVAALRTEREKSKRYEEALKFIKNKTESDDLLPEELRARSTSIYIKAREALASGGGE